MKKYYKPASKEIVLDTQALLNNVSKDPEGIDGGEVGAKRNYRIIIDDEEDY